MNEYNPKIDYLFAREASSLEEEKGIDEKVFRDVYQEKAKPQTKGQEKMLRIKKAFGFLKREECPFSPSTLLGAYAIYLDKVPDEDDVDIDRLNMAFSSFKGKSQEDYRDLFIVLIKLKPFKEEDNLIMSEIAANFLLVKQGRLPLIYKKSLIEKVLHLIEAKEEEGAKILLLEPMKRSKEYNSLHPYIPLEN